MTTYTYCHQHLVINSIPQVEKDFLSNLTGNQSFDGYDIVRDMPLYKASRCHQNCLDFIKKDEKSPYIILRGWLLDYDLLYSYLTYHSILMNVKTKQKIDVTSQVNASVWLKQQIFLLDYNYYKKAVSTLADGNTIIRYKPSVEFDSHKRDYQISINGVKLTSTLINIEEDMDEKKPTFS